MKNLIVIVVISITCFACNNKQQAEEKSNADDKSYELVTYSNKVNGYKFDYPVLWDTINKKPELFSFMAIENNPDTADVFNENLTVQEFLNGSQTIDEMIAEFAGIAKQRYANVEIGKTTIKTNNGLACTILQFKQEKHSIPTVTWSAFFANGQNIYRLAFTTEESKKNIYNPMVTKIINSFNWVES